MTDITFDLGCYTINLRVAAVVTYGEHVLVCRMKTENWWFLPGGRIKTNESSVDAITRELREEIGDCFRIHRPIVCAENFFNLHGVSFHELCTFYEVEWLGGSVISEQEDMAQIFKWISKSDVIDFDLKPDFIKRFIINPPPNLALVIHRDGRQTNAGGGSSTGT